VNAAAAILLCLAAGLAAGGASVLLLNRIPAWWLCDYDEQPDASLLEKRVYFFPHGTVFSAVAASVFLLYFFQYGVCLQLFAAAGTVLPLLWITFTDLRYRIIPDQFSGNLFVLALFYQLAAPSGTVGAHLLNALLGTAAGAGIILLMGLLGHVLFHQEAMGGGDLKLFAAVGTLSGLSGILPLFLFSLIFALIHILYLTTRGRLKGKVLYLPFGPSICFAAAAVTAFSSEISAFLSWYTALLTV